MNATPPILIVDDSAATQALLAEIVRQLGLTPHLAADAQQARTLLALHRYSVALIDRALPDGDGLELVRQMAHDSPSASVVRTARPRSRRGYSEIPPGS